MAQKLKVISEVTTMEHLDYRKPEKRDEPTKQVLSFPLGNDPSKLVQVRPSCLKEKEVDYSTFYKPI